MDYKQNPGNEKVKKDTAATELKLDEKEKNGQPKKRTQVEKNHTAQLPPNHQQVDQCARETEGGQPPLEE